MKMLARAVLGRMEGRVPESLENWGMESTSSHVRGLEKRQIAP